MRLPQGMIATHELLEDGIKSMVIMDVLETANAREPRDLDVLCEGEGSDYHVKIID
jgi:hypothetical protein